MNNFDVREIFEFALKIEEKGENFYRKYADKTEVQELKDIFNFLADEEIKHKNTFQRLLSKIEKYEPFENYPEEYFFYLAAFVENVIFKDGESSKEIENISNNIEALDFCYKKRD